MDAFLLALIILAVVVALILGYALGSRTSSATDEDDSEPSLELDDPTAEELQQLKQTLNLQKGSLTFKKGSIYHVTYENKKHHWVRLARWSDLKQRIENAVDQEENSKGTLQLPNPCLLFVQMGEGYVGFLRKEWRRHAASDQPYPPCCYPSPQNPKGCPSFLVCVGVEKKRNECSRIPNL